MSRRTPLAIALALSLAATAAGCTPGGGDAKKAKESTLVVGATVEPTTLDAFTNNAAAIPAIELYNVYQTLVKVDDTGALQPSLATSWDVSPDRLTYTFHLDPKATFDSGHKVTAADVVAQITKVKANVSNKVQSGQMEAVASATATDEHTVVVKLSHPSNMWLWNMSSTPGMIPEAKAGVDVAKDTAGSGPYQVKEWRRGQSITLERNPHFGGEKPAFDTVTFRFFTDATALNSAMSSGDIDIISNVQAPQSINQFSDASRFAIIEGTTNGEVVMGMNNTSPILKNVKIRQAINHAIDRKALVQTVWNGKGTLIGSMAVPTDPWYTDLSNAYPYDQAKAKQLIAASGITGPLRLRLRIPNLPYAVASAQFVTSALKDVGIEVTTDTLEFPARWLDEVYTKGNYDMTIVAHVEPRDITNWARPDYYWHYQNPAMKQLVDAADAGTPEVQKAKLSQAATLLSDDAAACFLFLLPNLVVHDADLTGVSKNATSLSFDLSQIKRN